MNESQPKSLLEDYRDRQDKAARRRRHPIDHDGLVNVFGKPLQRLRKSSGRSMLRAGVDSGLSDNTVWRIESGEDARLSSVIRLAKTYGYRLQLRFIRDETRG